MAKLQSDLSACVGLLNSHGVEYLVVGGHAVAFHGHPRFTGDIDFFVRPSAENADRVLHALAEFGFRNLGLTASDLTVAERIVQLGRPPNRVDILTSISGLSFEDAWASRVSGVLDGHRVHYLGLEALLRNKEASNRDKDAMDVKKLRAIDAKARGRSSS